MYTALTLLAIGIVAAYAATAMQSSPTQNNPDNIIKMPSDILLKRRERVTKLHRLSIADKNQPKVAQANYLLRMIDGKIATLTSSKNQFKYD